MSDETSPPPLPTPTLPPGQPTAPTARPKTSLPLFLSLSLLVLAANAALSFLDDTLRYFFDSQVLSGIRILVLLAAMMVSVVLYVSMAISRRIPKRVFLPLALVLVLVIVSPFGLMVFWFERLEFALWLINLLPIAVVLVCWRWAVGGWTWRWPLITEEQLGKQSFSWLHLAGYMAANVFILVPALLCYGIVCVAHAVHGMTDGFMTVGWKGLVAHAVEYRDESGNQVHLVPMMHVAQGSFFNSVVESFPTNSVILLEGVSDDKDRLKYKVTYKRMADKLGLAEQHEAFVPKHGELRVADVDISDFSDRTISLLNVAMQFHAEGFSLQWFDRMMQEGSDVAIFGILKEDLLNKRNHHVLQALKSELERYDVAVIPWGAAHMPGISSELEKQGFKRGKVTNYEVVQWMK